MALIKSSWLLVVGIFKRDTREIDEEFERESQRAKAVVQKMLSATQNLREAKRHLTRPPSIGEIVL